jgi:hypothetical protein
MKHRNAVITLLAYLCAGFCYGQDTAAGARCLPYGGPMTCVAQILRGAPFDSVKQFFSPEACVIRGNTRGSLENALRDKKRSAILNEDSTRRVMWIDVTGNDADDAQYVVMKTVGAHEEDPHLHSLVLYKKPAVGWQIYLWHVGS